VVLYFPFSDLSQTKRRLAPVLATLDGNDVILCQITSQAKSDQYSAVLDGADFESGGLNQPSRIRPNRLFTADTGIVLYATGRVRDGKLRESASAVLKTLDRQSTESGSVHKEVARLNRKPGRALRLIALVNMRSTRMRRALHGSQHRRLACPGDVQGRLPRANSSVQ
jgi:mRNA interferase MazF